MTTTAPDMAVPQFRFRAAFESVRAELAAVPASELLSINLDVHAAATTVLGLEPELIAQRPNVVALLPGFDMAPYDKCALYASALYHAQTALLASSVPPEKIQQMAEELVKIRETFVADVTALGRRELMDSSKLSQLKGANGHRNLTSDVFTLVQMFRSRWSDLTGKTPTQLAEIDHAEQLAEKLTVSLGLREQGTQSPTEFADARVRAFSLFMKAYDQVRRVITFTRWDEGDADEIAPSLYVAARASRKAEKPSPIVPSPTPVVTPVVTPASANPAAPNPSPGLVGEDPFNG